MKILLYILVIFLGVFFFIYGGYDDSPGAQLLGLVISVAGIVGVVRITRKKDE